MDEATPVAVGRWRLYGVAFLDEFGPLLTLYTVWFADNGLDARQISGIFFMWALVGLLAEVPSGALADRVDRRGLIVFALLIRMAGIALWMLWPTPLGLLTGAMMWALHSALASGTWEALVYDLVDADDDSVYASVMARVGQANLAGMLAGLGVATASLFAGANLWVLGWATVLLHVPAMLAVWALPPAPTESEEPITLSGWWTTLTSGVRAAASGGLVARLLAVGVLLEGTFVLDEYQPLLATLRGALDGQVPWFVLAIWMGTITGGEVAARWTELSGRALGLALLVASAVAFAVLRSGALWPLALIGAHYAVQYTVFILWEARFQERIPGAVRATVSSVRAFLGNALSLAIFAWIAWSDPVDPSVGLVLLVGLVAVAGVGCIAWLPKAVTRDAG